MFSRGLAYLLVAGTEQTWSMSAIEELLGQVRGMAYGKPSQHLLPEMVTSALEPCEEYEADVRTDHLLRHSVTVRGPGPCMCILALQQASRCRRNTDIFTTFSISSRYWGVTGNCKRHQGRQTQ
mmetsp:Transcript_116173/g.163281  ORF Transcript_116173/g.163281 Transcript_116173/m.163281 type:complete len:124 (+) Transcript_116173:593-964(+)